MHNLRELCGLQNAMLKQVWLHLVVLSFAAASILLRYPWWFFLSFWAVTSSMMLLWGIAWAKAPHMKMDKTYSQSFIASAVANLICNVGWGIIEMGHRLPLGLLLWKEGHLKTSAPMWLVGGSVFFQWLFPILLVLMLGLWIGKSISKKEEKNERGR